MRFIEPFLSADGKGFLIQDFTPVAGILQEASHFRSSFGACPQRGVCINQNHLCMLCKVGEEK